MTTQLRRMVEPVLPYANNTSFRRLFVVVGLGGTGGYLAPNLIRQLSLQQQQPNVIFVDGDHVEDKNIVRQNFIASDIGKNKAEVMAQRYGRAFGMKVAYLDRFLESSDDTVRRLMPQIDNNAIEEVVLVDCVDNNKTRRILRNVQHILIRDERVRSCVILSSGNEEYTGQVSFSVSRSSSSTDFSSFNKMVYRDYHIPYIDDTSVSDGEYLERVMSAREDGMDDVRSTFYVPGLLDLFQSARDDMDPLPTQLSCEEMAISAPQNIQTNMLAATVLFNFVNRLLFDDRIDQFLVYFDARKMSTRPVRFVHTEIADLVESTGGNDLARMFASHPNNAPDTSDHRTMRHLTGEAFLKDERDDLMAFQAAQEKKERELHAALNDETIDGEDEETPVTVDATVEANTGAEEVSTPADLAFNPWA